jgi:hypothetical protein
MFNVKAKTEEASEILVSAYHSTLNHNSKVSRIRERIFGYHFVFKFFVMSEYFFNFLIPESYLIFVI